MVAQDGRSNGKPWPGPRIALTTFSPAEDSLLQVLASILQDVFGGRVEIVEPIPLPRDSYSASRDQYQSAGLLDVLRRHRRADWDRLLGMTDVDLYTPDLNFVFGHAEAKHGVAVFSLARLHTMDRDRYMQRAATEAIHELAHTYGLSHCNDARCVMWFSNTLEETDRKGTRFCRTHVVALQQMMQSLTHG